MRSPLSYYFESVLQLMYPHNCLGCGADSLKQKDILCSKCILQLPVTGFFSIPSNRVEKIFYGRLPIQHAAAACYFTKASLIQHIITQLKYKNNIEAGHFLGRLMGSALAVAKRFEEIDVLIPLPLHPKKEHFRGYNQAKIICEGITEIWPKPIIDKAVIRNYFTDTQTHQNRISRWQNMNGIFDIADPDILKNKHVLLVDDVITTGATLEACGLSLLDISGIRLSIASAAFTLK